jgi:hypothetical protein
MFYDCHTARIIMHSGIGNTDIYRSVLVLESVFARYRRFDTMPRHPLDMTSY